MGNTKKSIPIMILALIMFSITLAYAIRESEFTDDGYIKVYPDNPDMAADYKINYAMMNPEEFAKSKILVYDYDIQFVERALKAVQENCAQKGTQCDRAKEYQSALAVMASMKAQQAGRPTEDTAAKTPSVEGGEKAKGGALTRLSGLKKKIGDLVGALLDEIRDTWSKLW